MRDTRSAWLFLSTPCQMCKCVCVCALTIPAQAGQLLQHKDSWGVHADACLVRMLALCALHAHTEAVVQDVGHAADSGEVGGVLLLKLWLVLKVLLVDVMQAMAQHLHHSPHPDVGVAAVHDSELKGAGVQQLCLLQAPDEGLYLCECCGCAEMVLPVCADGSQAHHSHNQPECNPPCCL